MIRRELKTTVLWSTLAISLVALTPVGQGRPAWVDAPVSRATYVLGARLVARNQGWAELSLVGLRKAAVEELWAEGPEGVYPIRFTHEGPHLLIPGSECHAIVELPALGVDRVSALMVKLEGSDAPIRLPLGELLRGEPGYSAALAQRFF